MQRGEIVLLRGPNGAGKTTLLRVCAGLLPLARGTGTVLGCDLATERDAIRRRVGLLGHRNGLYLDLTVAENVRFWGATVGASDDEIAAAMDRMGLGGRLAALPVRRLSAGQQRRTALACLVARRAELWLLDEPHAGLDADGRDELDVTLRQAAASGATVMVASHELERAGSLASRVRRRRRRPGRWERAMSGDGAHGLADRPQGPARRVAQPGRPQPGAAVRRRHDGDVRLRRRPLAGRRRARPTPCSSDVAPGLVWLATAVQPAAAGAAHVRRRESRTAPSTPCGSPASTPAAVFWGKTIALAVQLAVLDGPALGHRGRALRRRAALVGRRAPGRTWLTATIGLAAVGTLYGGLAAGARGRETLLPLLMLPVVAPVLIGATRAVEAALGTGGTAIADGWPWVGVVAVFAVAFGVGGTLAFGPLIDE